ncbi:MAG: N-acetylmuramoyl-L-alanine amidase, partial [Alphaproteobacteria bacterium]|nr:N-acetylmuramoyl-L-alanine amidase [Alphaproteobacteria bacterium]
MVSRPCGPANNGWQTTILFVLLAALTPALPGAAIAQATTGQGTTSLPFGLSYIFGNSRSADAVDRRTRITIDLRQKTTFEIFSLSNPNRVVIEMPQVGMRLPAIDRSSGGGIVQNLRAGQTAPGKSRIVIDVAEPVVVEGARIIPTETGIGSQLEMVLVPFTADPRMARADFTPSSRLGGPAAFAQPPVPRPARAGMQKGENNAYKPLIVIDPGHGGKDSGARKFGINEKDVVLAFGLTLRDDLLKTGRYRVKMTRDRDIFIPLHERREFSEDNTAALFIAVHADYAGTDARGATIYSLREEVANRLRQEAAAGAADEAIPDRILKNVSAQSDDLQAVRGILGDLAQRE